MKVRISDFIHRHKLTGWKMYAYRYGATVVLVALAYFIRNLFPQIFGRCAPFLLLFGVVIFVTWYFAKGPAWSAAISSAIIVIFTFNEFNFYGAIRASVFLLECYFLISLVCRIREAEQKARGAEQKQIESNKKLAEYLEERTRLLIEAQEALKVRDILFGVASHEIKNPLSAVKMNIEIMIRYALGGRGTLAEFAKRLEKASRTLDKVYRIVEDYMDVSRITTGKLNLQLEEFDFCEVVKDVHDRYSLTYSAEITLNMSHQRVHGIWDKSRLDQIVSNILSNAIKYGCGNAIEITCDGDHEMAYLMIKDRGVGIAPENQQRIFEKFERALSDNRVARVDGLGLGLWITRQLVNAMGGEIKVESTLGEGSSFFLQIPTHLDEKLVENSDRFTI